jgi:hypothetical protein
MLKVIKTEIEGRDIQYDVYDICCEKGENGEEVRVRKLKISTTLAGVNEIIAKIEVDLNAWKEIKDAILEE